MSVVSDASPLNYLIMIGAVDVLVPLYGRVFVPHTVVAELGQSAAPDAVRAWMAQRPGWLDVSQEAPQSDPTLALLDPGERAAITLALSLGAERLLIDEWEGRAEAVRRGLAVTGTLGILAAAHQRGLLDLEVALARLERTSFYMSKDLLEFVRRRLSI